MILFSDSVIFSYIGAHQYSVKSLKISGFYLFAALPPYICCLGNSSHLGILGHSTFAFSPQEGSQALLGLPFVALWPEILSRQWTEIIIAGFTCFVLSFYMDYCSLLSDIHYLKMFFLFFSHMVSGFKLFPT